jgi:GT2 family glycosyltransferase/glycosyltransferase involved in cell wall biosynthesis
MACVFSALATTFQDACEVVVINDGSPEPELVEGLRQWSRAGLFTFLENEHNLGFVRTVNRGMALHPDRDVVLLNSDALVYGNWLERLRRAAMSRPNIGTVTPFSNNAEICSYPEFIKNNHILLETHDASLDAMAARCNADRYVDIPTAVGFCMYIRRTCLNAVGPFDADKFGKGYGEENDFSLRATRKGWSHLLATDVFVRHCGGVSFGEGKNDLVAKGLKVLARDWPNYGRDIQAFIAKDPVFPGRRALDAARVADALKGRSTMLFITHDWGGGIERHIQAMKEQLRAEDVPLLVMRAMRNRPGWVALEHSEVMQVPNLRWSLQEDYRQLVEFLRQARVFHVHVHSLAGYPRNAPDVVAELTSDLAVAYDFTAHDYLPVCPRVTMIDESGSYCGEPELDACVRCVARNGAPVPVDSLSAYRDRYSRLMHGARRVFAPSADTAARYRRRFPMIEVTERSHPQGYRFKGPPPVRYGGDGILRVAIIGAIGPHKGSTLLLECARHAESFQLPIRFVVFGITDIDALRSHPYVTIKGAYRDNELAGMLVEHRCHVAFFPSLWPETWSYTLSEALDAKLYPVAFELGAMAERIKSIGWGTCLPVELMHRADLVNEHLLDISAPAFTEEVGRRITAGDLHYEPLLRNYYGLTDR